MNVNRYNILGGYVTSWFSFSAKIWFLLKRTTYAEVIIIIKMINYWYNIIIIILSNEYFELKYFYILQKNITGHAVLLILLFSSVFFFFLNIGIYFLISDVFTNQSWMNFLWKQNYSKTSLCYNNYWSAQTLHLWIFLLHKKQDSSH